MATPITIGAAGGEYMETVVVVEWAAQIGDHVKQGDIIVTVETAKAATDIEAPCDGILSAVFAEVGTEVPVADVLGMIGKSIDDQVASSAAPSPSNTELHSQADVPPSQESSVGSTAVKANEGRIVASPAARRAAAEAGLDLRLVAASSETGRIKLRDLPTLNQSAAATRDTAGALKVYRSGKANGIPLLLLHGFGADAMSWYPLEKGLTKVRSVIKMDLPNHGQSPKIRVEDFQVLMESITQAFDALGEDKVHLVGHSLGGACAIALAKSRPHHVASLTLIAPGGLGSSINDEFVQGLATASTPASLKQSLQIMVADKSLISSEFVGAAMASRAEPALRNAQEQMANDLFPSGVPRFQLLTSLADITCPTRIVTGRADEVIPFDSALQVSGLVGQHIFDAVGHVPHIEITEQVLEILKQVMRAE